MPDQGPSPSPTRLLLVEDERVLRQLVSQFLRRSGFEVAEAGDGPAAVERYDAEGPFDLILLDLNLPGFSGVEVCRQVRRSSPAQPVLICSAIVTDEAEGPLREMGVRGCLSKPYLPEDLIARIRAILGLPAPGPSARVAAHRCA